MYCTKSWQAQRRLPCCAAIFYDQAGFCLKSITTVECEKEWRVALMLHSHAIKQSAAGKPDVILVGEIIKPGWGKQQTTTEGTLVCLSHFMQLLSSVCPIPRECSVKIDSAGTSLLEGRNFHTVCLQEKLVVLNGDKVQDIQIPNIWTTI